MANDGILQAAEAVKLGLGVGQVGADLNKGATLGVGLKHASLDAATPLVLTPTVFVVLQTPQMYVGEDNNAMGKMIKTLMETHATAVSGVDLAYTLETSESPVGHDGQMLQVPTQTKRGAVTPSFTFPEVTGSLVWKLFSKWMRDIQDPDTNSSMANLSSEGNLPFQSSTYAMTMMGIQFDPGGHPDNIIAAAMYSNMFPTDPGGAFGFERTIATSKTIERNVTFTGLIQNNDSVFEVAKTIAGVLKDAKSRHGYGREPFYDKSIYAGLADSGLQAEVDTLVNA